MSMHAFTCEEIEPLLPAAAAGALDDEETAVVHAHVFDCARCLPRLAEYEGVVEQLAYAVPQVAPSPELLPRLLQSVEASAPVGAPAASPVSAPASPARPLAVAPPRGGWLDALLGAYRRLAPVGFVLAMLLVVLVGAWGLSLNSQVDRQREMIAMLRMPDSHSVAMQPMTRTSATAQVYMAPGHAEMGLVVQHLMPQPGRVYQLWLIMKDGRALPCGTVQVDDHGVAVGMIRLPTDPAGSVGVMITDESSSQPQVPTGTKWLEARYEQ